jgi:penicillin-binding protein 2
MPDNAWKTKRLREGWRSGDTCNLSIGQGFMLATPLQMAVFTAALANGGRVFRPRLVMQPWEEGDLVHRLPCAERSLALVRGGMYDVAQAETGTGKRARLEGVAIAAKTGSAEYGPATQRRKYGWMIAYAPFSPPRYAAAIVLEDVTSGGIDAAPRMGRLLGALLGVRTAAEAAAEAAATAAAQTESD